MKKEQVEKIKECFKTGLVQYLHESEDHYGKVNINEIREDEQETLAFLDEPVDEYVVLEEEGFKKFILYKYLKKVS